MYSDTITLFNHYTSPTADMWYPTVLRGVDLNADKAAIRQQYGESSQDSAKLHIKYRIDANSHIIVGGKLYLTPKAWEEQTNDELSDTITFRSGQDFDFFVVGDYGTEPINDNDYFEGLFSFLSQRHDDVYAITSVARYSVIPHFEIMAR